MLKPVDLPLGAKLTLSINWSNYLARLGKTASTSAWAIDGNAVTVGNDSLASNVASAQFTAAHTGCAIAKNTLTMTDTDIAIEHLIINVYDPKCCGN